MRWYLLACLLAGCSGGDGACTVDSDCHGGLVCARDGECLAASDVRMVHVTWTIRGMPASATTCMTAPNFYIMFASTDVNDTFGYEPVPCEAGVFSVDKLPKRFISVEIGVDGRFAEAKPFDAAGNAVFDLVF